MASQLIPLFPLSVVLLPSMPLPLHVFEERYKEMMTDIMSSGGEFGVVFARGEGIVSIGCSATIERVVRRYEDGRLDLLAVGQRRFEISALDHEKSYLRASVDFFNDEDATQASSDLRGRVNAAYRKLAELDEDDLVPEPKWENSRMSFQLARYIDDFEKRQAVLSMRSEIERLEFLVKVIPQYISERQLTALAKRVGPLNGHAKTQ